MFKYYNNKMEIIKAYILYGAKDKMVNQAYKMA